MRSYWLDLIKKEEEQKSYNWFLYYDLISNDEFQDSFLVYNNFLEINNYVDFDL